MTSPVAMRCTIAATKGPTGIRPRRHPRPHHPRTRGLVLINPNNPTGAVYGSEFLLEVIEIARQHNLIIFADEIYDKILYDDISTPASAPCATM